MEEAFSECYFTDFLYSKIKTAKYNMFLSLSYNDNSCYDFLPEKQMTIHTPEAIIYFHSLLSHSVLILFEIGFFYPLRKFLILLYILYFFLFIHRSTYCMWST